MTPFLFHSGRARCLSTRRVLAALSLALGVGVPMSAFALLQTSNDRTPTWTMFKVHAMGDAERGAFLGLGLFCQFPEQYPPKVPNPRWETERPMRPHFVEHLNPKFMGCKIRPFVELPQFTDFKIPTEYEFEFEKQLPPGFEPYRTGERTARILTNLKESRGRQLAVPELAGTPDQQVVLRFSIFGKQLSQIGFRIDSGYSLRFYEYDRTAADKPPYVFRQWGTP